MVWSFREARADVENRTANSLNVSGVASLADTDAGDAQPKSAVTLNPRDSAGGYVDDEYEVIDYDADGNCAK